MKKLILSAAAALCAVAGAWAAPVSVDRAKTTAVTFVKSRTGRNVTVKEVVAATDTYYIFNMTNGGWVIVSADDTSSPVLGYNTTGSLNWHSIPDNMTSLLGAYSREIKAVRSSVRAQHSAWKNMTAAVASRAEGAVEPLIPVTWNQTPPYNTYCPGSGSNKAIVGCVAVAMSQAMSVQRYPLQPQGSKSYTCTGYGQISINYDAEKSYDWDRIITGANNYDDAAKLLFHAGVSVEMGYGKDASGIPTSQVSRIPSALANHFGYDSRALNYHWRSAYSGDWNRLVLNELSAGRAVIYNAVDDVNGYGHSFNVDGYDGVSLFHLNWGWGGLGNGYFTLDNLSDASMGMNYNAGHVVVVGIGSPNQVLRSIELSSEIIDEKLPAGTVLGQITVNGETPKSTFSIEVRGKYDPETRRYLEIPFELKDNLIVTKNVLTAQAEPIEVNVFVTDSESKQRLSSSFSVTVCKLRTLAQATSMNFDRQSGDIVFKTRYGADYKLTGSNGTVIATGSFSPVPELKINMNQLQAGENVLTLSIDGTSKSFTIKK